VDDIGAMAPGRHAHGDAGPDQLAESQGGLDEVRAQAEIDRWQRQVLDPGLVELIDERALRRTHDRHVVTVA
jgi:hypothetical protein